MAGTSLVPPLGAERASKMGQMVPFSVSVEGDDWKRSSTDVAIAGLSIPGNCLHTLPCLMHIYSS